MSVSTNAEISSQIAIEVFDNDIPKLDSILPVTKLGKFNITCKKPLSNTICSGVIGPVETDIPVRELEEILKCQTAEIYKISRLPKFNKLKTNNRKEPSATVKIDFYGNTLPAKVFLDNISFIVRKYNLPPLRCYKCQKRGHMAGGCRGKDICNICGENHRMQDCKASSPRCANCSGPHAASSRECPLNKAATEAMKQNNTKQYQRPTNSTRAQQILRERGIPKPSTNDVSANHNQTIVTADVHQSAGTNSGKSQLLPT